MKKGMSVLLAFIVLVAFFSGCARYVPVDTQVKCPKCGEVFMIYEGLGKIGP